MAIPLSNPVITSYITGIKITPYVNGAVGSDSFYAQKVVAGAALAQADDTRTNIDSETEDSPIFIAVTKGEKTFTLNVADLQPALLVQYFGAIDVAGSIYMPAAVSTVYAQLTIEFKEGYKNIIFPKVQMNAKLVGESLKSSVMQAQIVCTALVGTYGGRTTDVLFTPRGSSNGAVTLRTSMLANPIVGGITVVCELVDFPIGTDISTPPNTIGVIHATTENATYLTGTVVACNPIPLASGAYTIDVTGLTTGTHYFKAYSMCTSSLGSNTVVYGEEISASITGA